MVLKLLVTIILVLCQLSGLAEATSSLAKPNCPSSCGNESIPYPFGIGNGCFYNEWFEVTCNTSFRSHRAFLKRVNLEVFAISLNKGTLLVNIAIFFSSNCSGKSVGRAINLEGSPFLFSQNNWFTAIGCNILATMTNGPKLVGCRSTCYESPQLPNNWGRICNGTNCCQIDVPLSLKVLNATLERTNRNEESKGCNYAFLVDQEWFSSLADPSKLQNMDYVPVTLDWGIFNTEYFPYNPRNPPKDYSCTEIRRIGNIQKCICSSGYEGNPHLQHGCQDINECTLFPNICDVMACENAPGSYMCQAKVSPTMRIISIFVSVVFAIVGAALVLLIIMWSCKKMKKRKDTRRKKKFFKRNGGLLLKQIFFSSDDNFEKTTRLFHSEEIVKATDHFNKNRILGQGGQGTVYKGMLADGKIIAVKQFKIIEETEVNHFINEVAILSQVNQRNIVKLLGCCLETEVPLLVYEFISNGTLHQYIHGANEEIFLSWEMRVRIATEVAGALAYLHSSASMPIYHRDIKSTNILLDEKFTAKVADFGTSRSVSVDQTHLTTQVKGTFGYLDPEYFQTSQFTDKSDVYSFGIVLVELLTGQKPVSLSRSEEGIGLASYFVRAMEENRLIQIVDPRVMKEDSTNGITAVASVAMSCLNLTGNMRPTMKEVALELEGIHAVQRASYEKQDHQKADHVRREISEQSWYGEDTISLTLPRD